MEFIELVKKRYSVRKFPVKVAYFDPEVVKEKLALTEGVEPVAFLPVGYPATDSKPSQSHFSRFETDSTVFRNSF